MSDLQVSTDVFKTYPKDEDGKLSDSLDWADRMAVGIAEEFIQKDGHFNWHLPDFDWCSLNRMIAGALRRAAREGDHF